MKCVIIPNDKCLSDPVKAVSPYNQRGAQYCLLISINATFYPYSKTYER